MLVNRPTLPGCQWGKSFESRNTFNAKDMQGVASRSMKQLRSLFVIPAAIALVFAGYGAAIVTAGASTPTVTYYACLSNGTLTGVGTRAPSCAAPGAVINWNQVGPQGSTGPAGARGPSGAAGTRGPAGQPATTVEADESFSNCGAPVNAGEWGLLIDCDVTAKLTLAAGTYVLTENTTDVGACGTPYSSPGCSQTLTSTGTSPSFSYSALEAAMGSQRYGGYITVGPGGGTITYRGVGVAVSQSQATSGIPGLTAVPTLVQS